MKKILILAMVITGLTAFTGGEGDTGNVKELAGYQLKSRTEVFNDFNLWVITSNPAFENVFIAVDESAAKPTFENEIVVAAKAETRVNAYKTKFRKIVKRGNELDVFFTVKKEGPSMDGAAQATVAIYPRNAQIKKVNFYHDNILVRSIPIVNVY